MKLLIREPLYCRVTYIEFGKYCIRYQLSKEFKSWCKKVLGYLPDGPRVHENWSMKIIYLRNPKDAMVVRLKWPSQTMVDL